MQAQVLEADQVSQCLRDGARKLVSLQLELLKTEKVAQLRRNDP